ncbi:glycosyltransferase family 2 protein [Pseudothioclava arenosa]|uniref:Glycosyl transferase n=1 Tax=Pseudothioclava arenosa TaxID=1795308 RepID=A0A2A4CSI4_9RHOB|nr:glycosyltransferase [Pseudothioclava arenosa]PCD77109.1 glycosyl transferase [Pseudothioclava arenosa]
MADAQHRIVPSLNAEAAPISLSVFLNRPGLTSTETTTPRPQPGRTPLGQILLEMEAISPGDLLKALAIRNRQDVRLGDILLAHGWVTETALMAGLARQWKAAVVDLYAEAPDPRLIDAIGPETCLTESMVPWRQIGGTTLIATARPEDFAALRARLPARFAPYRMVLAPERDIHDSLLARRQTALIRRAETKVDPEKSCRTRNEARASRLALAVLSLALIGLMLAPIEVFALLFGWLMLTLVLSQGLKTAAFLAEFRARHLSRQQAPARPLPRLPIISVMVPLFHERDIAGRLIERLGRLDYPRELLDILLVVEEDDLMTRNALAQSRLPRWMRVVTVPTGPIQTKPRALNYALSFCRGTIIGVYDAEDAPEPEQLHKVARHFAHAAPEVACLQGRLDYYNPRTNWLARCFTIEYAAWFRVFLPGIARLGFVIPLGGTTLFFRRAALEALGGWDAHNVTEDADLGIRLARHGLRTELVDTVTHEEANCRTLPWIKQRSRWLKGYAMTWAVHMRNPARLWRELGPKRFFGVQVLILGALTQFVFAPLFWSMWLIPLGIWHPVEALMSKPFLYANMSFFALSEAVNIALGLWAVRGRGHRHLIPWVPSLHFYFPLAALAGWKALYEVIAKPFYWDKTVHGVFDTVAPHQPRSRSGMVGDILAASAPPPAPARVPVAPQID